MTLFLSLREQARAGSVVAPRGLDDGGTADPAALRLAADEAIAAAAAGRDVLLAAHGFNVDRDDGVRHLGALDHQLALGAGCLFLGVLWPGDWWIPAINYPFEGDTAMACGRLLAEYCRRWLGGARSLSFLSHSLGARLVLEAVAHLDRRARSVCLTAGAINDDCLAVEYRAAAGNADAIAILSSRCDDVLKLAFPVGDPIADLLHDDHTPLRRALGAQGPTLPTPPPASRPWQIPDEYGIGHGDYVPPRLDAMRDFMVRAFRGTAQVWPPS